MELSFGVYSGTKRTPLKVFKEIFQAKMGERAPIMVKQAKGSIDNKKYRAASNEAMRSFFSWESDNEGKITRHPILYVTDDCPKFWESITKFVQNPDSHKGLDFEDTDEDHYYDAAKAVVLRLESPKIIVDAAKTEWWEELYATKNVGGPEVISWRDPLGVKRTLSGMIRG